MFILPSYFKLISSSQLSVHFNGHFPGELGLAGFIGVRIMEVVMTTGAIRRAKRQSNHHYQQTNTQFFYRPDALPANIIA